MRVYLAGEFNPGGLAKIDKLEQFYGICKHRLFSYHYHPKENDPEIHEYNRRGIDLFLDSGAYTAFTQGVAIDIDAYASYIRANKFFYPVANLDVIGDTGAKSYTNMEYLIGKVGADVIMPVFHLQDNIEWLHTLLAEGHKYIALGGMVGARDVVWAWLDKVWEHLVDDAGVPKLKVHGFGLTSFRAMSSYPWYSVDSSSWIQGAAYGGSVFVHNGRLIQVSFSENSPSMREINSWHFNSLAPAQQEQVRAWLDPLGITPEQMATYWGYRFVNNANSFMQLGHLAPTTYKPKTRTLFDA